MSSPAATQSLSLLRKLYRELRTTLPIGQKHVYDCHHWKYIVSLARTTNTTGQQDEQKNTKLYRLGQNYLGYLEHSRKYSEILSKYQGKGEMTPEQLATQLGFRMPLSEPPESENQSNSQTSSSCSQ